MCAGGVLEKTPVGRRGHSQFDVCFKESNLRALTKYPKIHGCHAKITLMRLAVLILASLPLLGQTEIPKTEEALRVLFLGNSYTYYNSLPDMVAAISNSTPGRRIETKSVTRGGATLQDLWHLTNALETLRSGTWDYVVLQDQSTLGENYVDGKWGVNEPNGLLRWVRIWNAEIQRKNAKPMLYLTWGRKAYPEFQTGLNYAYAEAAREIGATISPVGLAWKRIRETQPQIELFDADGTHPSPLGTYLNACVFVEVLMGKTCEGATRNPTTLRVPEDTQRLLTEAAHFAVGQYKAGILTSLPKPDYGTLKPLPPSTVSKSDDFTGTWRGKATMYNATQDVELKLEGNGRTCRGSITLSSKQKQTSLSYPLSNCTIDMTTLIFLTSDPRFLVEEYKAVIDGDKLVGTQTLRNTDPYVRLQGSFELRKD